MPRWFGCFLLATAACRPSVERVSREINTLADIYLARWVAAHPTEATASGITRAPHDQLPDLSPEALAAWQSLEDSLAERLEQLDVQHLQMTPATRITFQVLQEVVNNGRGYRVCRMALWNVSPTWTGWISEFSSLARLQPVATPAEQADAVKRFRGLPRYVDQEIANLRSGIQLGYTAPRRNVEIVIRQADDLLKAPIAASPWVQMAADSAPDFRTAMEAVEQEAIRPALKTYRDFLATEYLPAARTLSGVSANPNGLHCYAQAVQYHATVALSADSIHRIGLAEMASIHDEIAGIAQRLFGSRDVPAALRRLRSDPKFAMGSREKLLQTADAAVARAEAAVPQWFGTVPRAKVIVQPVPSFAEASAPGGFYNPPAADGSRPGTYTINLYEADTKPRAGVEATAFHETYPGHHLQGAIAQENPAIHPLQRSLYFSGFGEGWALYAERLADEMGLYSGDVDRMGLLSNEALRAARLVVDSGLHGLGWTREQAVDYMLDNTAESRSSVIAEVDRYIAVPGQATSYMLGNLEIRTLREKAHAALGARFDIRAFHDQVLRNGALPLSVLRTNIDQWVRESAEGSR